MTHRSDCESWQLLDEAIQRVHNENILSVASRFVRDTELDAEISIALIGDFDTAVLDGFDPTMPNLWMESPDWVAAAPPWFSARATPRALAWSLHRLVQHYPQDVGLHGEWRWDEVEHTHCRLGRGLHGDLSAFDVGFEQDRCFGQLAWMGAGCVWHDVTYGYTARLHIVSLDPRVGAQRTRLTEAVRRVHAWWSGDTTHLRPSTSVEDVHHGP